MGSEECVYLRKHETRIEICCYFFFNFKIMYSFISGCSGSSLPCGLFSSSVSGGHPLFTVCGILIAGASLENGL